MPLHPPPVHAEPDHRFDAYRERAGILSFEGEPFGTLYLRLRACWRQLGGHLWWSRWSEPQEQVTGYIAPAGGGFDDFVQDAATLVDELQEWDRGLFPYRGLLMTVEWLDDAGSRRVCRDVFGLDESD